VVELPRRVRGCRRRRGGRAVIAHIAGFPLEELLPSLGGAGAALLAARGWVALQLRRRREPGT
jgi:hypothetical protein